MIGLLMMLAESGEGGFVSGNYLLALCRSDRTACTAYVTGVSDATEFYQAAHILPKMYCVPPGVTDRRITDVVVRYLDDHPATRHEGASGIVSAALREGFTC